MQLPYLSKLKNTLKRFIDSTAAGATLKSPEAAAVMKAEAIQNKLDRLESVTDSTKRAKVVAEAATTLAAVKPRTLSQANDVNETLVTALDALKTEMAAGAPSSNNDDADDSPLDELIGITDPNVRSKNFENAEERLRAANRCALEIKQSPLAVGSSPGVQPSHSSAAERELEFLSAQFIEAGLVMPSSKTAGVHKGYLKQMIAHKVKSGAFGAQSGGAHVGAVTAVASDVLTVRKAAIEIPPTQADIYDVYQKLHASGDVEKRQAFYALHGSAISSEHRKRQLGAEQTRRLERRKEELAASQAAQRK